MTYILGANLLLIQGGFVLGALMGPCHYVRTWQCLGAALVFGQGGHVLGTLVGSFHVSAYQYKESVSEPGNITFFIEMDTSPTIIIIGQKTDSRIDRIIGTILKQRKAVIIDVDAFQNMISLHVSAVMLYGNLESVKQNLKFLVLADIGTIRPLLQKAQQLDEEIGAGILLRHFSRWLVVLTTGELHAFIIDDIVLDNVAVTTIDNISGSLCKNITLLQTMMWKNASRQLQYVSRVPTEDLSSRIFPNTKNGLNGRKLKAAMLPWLSCKVNIKSKTFSGPCEKLLSHLSHVYNFSYTYVEPEDRSWGTYDNGTWDGIMGLLVNKTVDISAVPYAWNLVRSHHVTFLYPIRYPYQDILYKKQDAHVDWTILLSCFKWQVYLCGLAVLVGVTTFFLVLKKVSVEQNGRNKLDSRQTLQTILSTIGVTCNQGSSTLPTAESYRILLAFWWLCCIPITSVISGNLVAFLTVSKDNVPFTGLEDLLDSGYDIGIETGSYIEAIFSMSNDSVNKQIWNKTRKHQRENLTIEEVRMYHRTRLVQGWYAFITDRDNINSYMAERCDMAHTKKKLFQSTASLIVPRHSPLGLLMNPELLALDERGVIDKWYEQPPQKEILCSYDNGLEPRDFLAALVAVGCGVGLAAFVLVFEMCKNKALSDKKRALEGNDL